MSNTIKLSIIEEYEDFKDVRIDKFLADVLSDMSRSYIKKLFDESLITVNDKKVKPSYKLRIDDELSITVPEAEVLDVKAEDIPLDIVYEDDDIIVVNKPKGMVVHPAAGHYSGTLVNALMYHCKDNLSTINGVMRPGIVHRIDKDTTGLLLVCKSDAAHRIMSEKFKIHDITRIYTAICYNHFGEEEGRVEKPIARSKNDRKKMAIDPLGRNAITNYKVIKNLSKNMSLIECKLETGRTHQIRVHMASISHPLLGDLIYGPNKNTINVNTDGQALHAGVLGFEHPITKEYMEFSVPLPEYMDKIIAKLS